MARAAPESVPLDVLAERVRPAALARDRQLPVLPPLAPLLPGGALRRGAIVAVGAEPGLTGATSLALALAAGPSQAGSWVAAVGLGSLGVVAASGFGVALDRFVLVPEPDRSSGATGWAAVVAALVDGFDVVLVAAGSRRRPSDARRLVARVRERGAVLLVVGGDLPEPSPVRLSVTAGAWPGLDRVGHLRGRRVTVAGGGRGGASRPRRTELWLPTAAGGVATVEPDPAVALVPDHAGPGSGRTPGRTLGGAGRTGGGGAVGSVVPGLAAVPEPGP